MKVIKKSEAKRFVNSESCTGFEFGFGNKELNIAVVTVNGRYPDKGHLVNDVCREIGYVLHGTGIVGIGKTTHGLSPGDAVMIEPGEKFYWHGESLEMLMPCAPAFFPEQHRETEQ